MNTHRLALTAAAARVTLSSLLALTVLLGGLALLASPVEAAPIHYVDDTGDDDSGVNDCSVEANPCATIEHAIDEAQPGDIIQIAAGTYTEPNLVINEGITLQGDGAASTILQADTTTGNAMFPVISVVGPADNVTIEGVTIRYGSNDSGSGGGIHHGWGNLTVRDSIITLNDAFNHGGGIYSIEDAGTLTIDNTDVTNNTAGSHGGGIYSESTLIVSSDSEISGNQALGGGGIFSSGDLTLTDSTIDLNHATTVNGGGLRVLDAAMIQRATITNNTAVLDGGGVAVGACCVTVTIEDSTIENNTADRNGGGVDIDVVLMNTPSQLTLTNTDLVDNHAVKGGGIHNEGTTIINGGPTGGSITQNDATGGSGGGIYNGPSGDLTLNEVTVSQNTTTGVFHGGGIYNEGGEVDILGESRIEGNNAQSGAGIANRAGGSVDVADSSVSLNIGTNNGLGGGIFNGDPGSEVTLSNATIFSNQSDGSGGGIYNMLDGVVTATNSTFLNNHAATDGGGIAADGGTVTVHDSTFALNNAQFDGGAIHVTTGSVFVDDASLFTQNAILTTGFGAVAVNETGALRIEESAIIDNTYPVGHGAIYTTGGATTVWQNWWGAEDGPGGVGPGSGEAIQPAGGALTYHDWLSTVVLSASPASAYSGDNVEVTGEIMDSDSFSAGVSPMQALFSHSTGFPVDQVEAFPSPSPSAVTHSFAIASPPDTVTASIMFRGQHVGLEGSVVVAEGPPPADISTDEPETPSSLTDAGVTIDIDPDCYEEATVPASGGVTLTTSGDCPPIRVTAPDGALPPGHTLVLGVPEDVADLPAAADGAPRLGFIVQLLSEDGEVVTDALEGSVTIRVTVDAELLPESGVPALAFWDGDGWSDLAAEATTTPSGAVVLTVDVEHFTIFGVVSSAACVLTPEPAAWGVSLALTSECAIEDLPPADSYWVTVDGRFAGYNPTAPDFVNASFFALYPDAIIPDGTVLIVAR